ncbi:hypothetical protein [Acidovorax sp. FG27]|uniref:hypothetical protein n=1 Tax=Acidovorax sp. FG27 TaxID=3133652 RepID=UPI0030E8BA40
MPYEQMPGNTHLVSVDIGPGWRAYQPAGLPGWDFLGVVCYHGVLGALALSWTSGAYALIVDGRVRFLDRATVDAAVLQAKVWSNYDPLV